MKLYRLILLCICLQGCVSPYGAAEFRQGQMYYEDGEFKKALHMLLPSAVAGNPKAQYAVGYMYYYGYGVTQDTETGVFWIKKAADCNYRAAIKALHLINEQNTMPETIKAQQEDERKPFGKIEQAMPGPEPEPTPSLRPEHLSNDEVLRSMHFSPPAKSKKVSELKSSIDLADVKKSIHSDGYGLQLFGSYELEAVKKRQIDLGVQQSAVIWHAEHEKKDWYVLMYGHYKTVADARFAIAKLPENLRQQGPWVRNLDGLG